MSPRCATPRTPCTTWSTRSERVRIPRDEAVFPTGVSRTDKYWCPVGRVDNVYGDRNLVCICPTPDEYRDEAA